MKDYLPIIAIFSVLVFLVILAVLYTASNPQYSSAQRGDVWMLQTQVSEMRQDIHSMQTEVSREQR